MKKIVIKRNKKVVNDMLRIIDNKIFFGHVNRHGMLVDSTLPLSIILEPYRKFVRLYYTKEKYVLLPYERLENQHVTGYSIRYNQAYVWYKKLIFKTSDGKLEWFHLKDGQISVHPNDFTEETKAKIKKLHQAELEKNRLNISYVRFLTKENNPEEYEQAVCRLRNRKLSRLEKRWIARYITSDGFKSYNEVARILKSEKLLLRGVDHVKEIFNIEVIIK